MSDPQTFPAEQIPQQQPIRDDVKFCKHCGKQIHKDAVLCVHCGRQVEELNNGSAPAQTPNIVINNNNTSSNSNVNQNTNTASIGAPTGTLGRARNKWVALVLCLFLGYIGAHKFYEGKIGMGILYIFTFGLLVVGIVKDFIALLSKPNPYYV